MTRNIIKILIYSILILIIDNAFAVTNIEEKYSVSSSLKNKILNSSLKFDLNTGTNQKIIAYLFAEDEKKEEREVQIRNSDLKKITISKGRYYIYLYSVENKDFYPYRMKIFELLPKTSFNVEGSSILKLSDENKKYGDILLISQFGNSTGDIYEAYGFSKNKQYLVMYDFLGAHLESSFYGLHMNRKPGIYMYGVYGDRGNYQENLKLEVSDKYGEIKVLNLDRK